MCPLSGLAQILLLVLAILMFNSMININALQFKSEIVNMHMGDTISVPYTILRDEYDDDEKYWLQLKSSDENVVSIENEILNYTVNDFPLKSAVNITGIFLGKASVTCRNVLKNEAISGDMDVIVERKKRLIDRIFQVSVPTLVSIIYINFGCALNWGELRQTLKKPVGPVIGLCGHFILMPLLSYGLGQLIFPGNHAMQLGMFFTGVSPAGGASNIWTLVLDGNVDLSITMTTISTLAAFGMMPLWLFTLGKLIFDEAKLSVPYSHIAYSAVGLIIPLTIGYLLTRYCKKLASFLSRILKGLSSLLILFIIIFATVTNLYLFKLFSWQIVVAGMGLPYVGFILAFILAKVLRQPIPDCRAIAIETGVQNSGIAIFLLRASLTQPEADLTTVCPVAVSIMTPLPLFIIYIYNKIQARIHGPRKKINGNASITPNAECQKSFTVFEEESDCMDKSSKH